MKLLNFDETRAPVRRLFQPLEDHLGVVSILAGQTPGSVYVDDPIRPECGAAWFHSRVYLAGKPAHPHGWQDLAAFFSTELIPRMLAAQTMVFILHTELEHTLKQVADLLPGHQTFMAMRRLYTCTRRPGENQAMVPTGYELRPVDARLLADAGIGGLDWLRDEMLSERPSLEDFLHKSFGVCLIHDHEIAGWCLSEYNIADRCEVGVAVAEAHQRRGLGTKLTLALLEEAFSRGYKEIGWHCWSENLPSRALAEGCGFYLKHEMPVLIWNLKATNSS